MESTIQIVGEDNRQFYYNAIITKISDLKRYRSSMKDTKTTSEVFKLQTLDELIDSAISFKNLFNIKNTTITLTRSDVDLLTRILNTSA
jgi:hypothetical protein